VRILRFSSTEIGVRQEYTASPSAITTQAPVALILSPLLTGGKVFDK